MMGCVDDGDGNAEEGRQPTQAEFEHWLGTARFIDDPREIEFNLTAAPLHIHRGGSMHINMMQIRTWHVNVVGEVDGLESE